MDAKCLCGNKLVSHTNLLDQAGVVITNRGINSYYAEEVNRLRPNTSLPSIRKLGKTFHQCNGCGRVAIRTEDKIKYYKEDRSLWNKLTNLVMGAGDE